MSHPAYKDYRITANAAIGTRSRIMEEVLGNVAGIKFNKTKGAFYNTVIFDEGVLDEDQFLPVENKAIKSHLEKWLEERICQMISDLFTICLPQRGYVLFR